MNIKNQEVTHKKYGVGTVISQTESHVVVLFGTEEKKFQYPDAFENYLTLSRPELCEEMKKEIEKIKQLKKEIEKAEQLKRHIRTQQAQASSIVTTTRKKKISKTERPNVAFKCNYCDGGQSSSAIGFNGVCSDEIIRYNIEVEKRAWCSSEDSSCFNYLCGNLSRGELEMEVMDGDSVCYESQMLRDWKAMAGMIQNGPRKGEPMRLKDIQANSLCVLTTREPYSSKEADRIIFAVFLTDETYEGDEYDTGYVSTQSKFRLSLSQAEARKMLFWRYHANNKNPKNPAWNSGLHRYLTNVQALQILIDIEKIKRNTADGPLAAEFLEKFSKIVGIEVKNAGSPNGALM